MSLKAQIQADFVAAMKQKNETAKTALSGLKAKITEQEKALKTQELSDADVIKVINTAVKQRKESADAFNAGERPDLAAKELAESAIISVYLPAQMSEEEIRTAILAIHKTFIGKDLPTNALRGKCQGEFNKQYPGRANPETLRNVINNIFL